MHLSLLLFNYFVSPVLYDSIVLFGHTRRCGSSETRRPRILILSPRRDRNRDMTKFSRDRHETETFDLASDTETFNAETETFSPRCIYMECWRGIAMRILSVRLAVRPSVCLSNACIVTKRKKDLSSFYTTRKTIKPSFLRRMVGGGDPFYLKFRVNLPRGEIADFKPIFARLQP